MKRASSGFCCFLSLWATGCGVDAPPPDDGEETPSSPPPTRVTCDWYSGNNCWKTSVAVANACIDAAERGVLDADRRGCSYPENVRLTFARPVVEDHDQSYVWDFSIERAGVPCATFQQFGANGEGGFSFVTDGRLRQQVVGDDLNYSCPDGEVVSIGAAESLDCDEGLPAILWNASRSAVSLAFVGGASDEVLFDCRLP